MRRFIRHPFDIPIFVESLTDTELSRPRLSNMSLGGLCFHSNRGIAQGEVVKVKIGLTQPPFEVQVRVVWCDNAEGIYEVGAEMLDPDEAYRTRMVEQLCHIEHYKREVWMRDGRRLSSEQAALEWIDKYAADFPKIYEQENEETISH
ncbi:MAG: PilZ domain-containing protein [Gammaproteobacteria bacterium]|nr:PilZ domain-containing protein [Gammaproteobacteria bacterium]MDH5693561.1 PilZ domain-containing protein [Gammaproteobacteria bacterium]